MGTESSEAGGRLGAAFCDAPEFEVHPKTGLSYRAIACACLTATWQLMKDFTIKSLSASNRLGWTVIKKKSSFQETMVDSESTE